MHIAKGCFLPAFGKSKKITAMQAKDIADFSDVIIDFFKEKITGEEDDN